MSWTWRLVPGLRASPAAASSVGTLQATHLLPGGPSARGSGLQDQDPGIAWCDAHGSPFENYSLQATSAPRLRAPAAPMIARRLSAHLQRPHPPLVAPPTSSALLALYLATGHSGSSPVLTRKPPIKLGNVSVPPTADAHRLLSAQLVPSSVAPSLHWMQERGTPDRKAEL
ncbi:hypothetical protein C8R45DRAFT_1115022 [Mycena sanguinolenta]|nr:hypothetical protein C8R45DRAFT_1115022 [Mycena sanguinolenta]